MKLLKSGAIIILKMAFVGAASVCDESSFEHVMNETVTDMEIKVCCITRVEKF
jgi:hypothetical protein